MLFLVLGTRTGFVLVYTVRVSIAFYLTFILYEVSEIEFSSRDLLETVLLSVAQTDPSTKFSLADRSLLRF